VALPKIGNHPFFDTVGIDRDIDVALVAQLADVSERDFRQLNPSHNKPVIMAAGTPNILLPWDNALLFQERLRQHQGPTASWTVWRVPSNMTAAAAAERHGMTEQELREVNRIPPRMLLQAGSTVLVPRQGRLDADVPEHIADNGQIVFVPERSAQRSVRVKVRAGDTLASFARRHRVSVADLREWNKLRADAQLRSGQTLLIVREGGAAPTTTAKASGSSNRKPGKTQATKTASAKSSKKTPASTTAKKATAKPTAVASTKSAVSAR
jgi:membrane-bound lytic murein transglycosylase D